MKRIVCIAAFCVFLLGVLLPAGAMAQELRATVDINSQAATSVDPQVFQELQQAITSFLNERKWSSDNFEDLEKIECSFFINILEEKGNNSYNASLTVIANRPVYNTSYNSTLINRFDKDLSFTYKQFDPLDFNENQFINNLTHTLAFYVYFILGMDYDSYEQNGGDVYFQKAQELVNNVPSTSGFSGWRSFDNNNQNRYWLINNILNSRYAPFREGNYTYHRLGLDRMIESKDTAMLSVLTGMVSFSKVGEDAPNLPIMQLLSDTKRLEWLNLFSEGKTDVKSAALGALVTIDPNNIEEYRSRFK
ncbi:MAG: DUF4835 domain-containing protein [Saprospirales bacterium]|nr:DUF4835 domain-containing protein [Saprospirales bacterium]|tara:strand:- start:870 stop:1787 length:918 start_codon:yes stop_codon:yes gene_type:complete